jgi:hypothetical protein
MMIEAAIIVPGEISCCTANQAPRPENAGLEHEAHGARQRGDGTAAIRRCHLFFQGLFLDPCPAGPEHRPHAKCRGHFRVAAGFFSCGIGAARNLAGFSTGLSGEKIIDHGQEARMATAITEAIPSTGCMR